jgi:hypothetical protein
MSTLTIPAVAVPYIRAGAQMQVAGAAEQLSTVIGEAMRLGVAPACERRRLLRAWALVDLLGWPDEIAGPVELDVREHREALIGALEHNVERLAELISDAEGDPLRASREDDLQALRQFEGAALRAIERDRPTRITTTMPAPVAVLLRGALYAELMRACEDAPGTMPESQTRAGWTPVLRRIDSAVDGLSALGWVEPSEQEPVTIVLGTALVEILEADAEQWAWLSEQERTESAEGRARAAEHAATIERFLASIRPADRTPRG